MHCDAEPRFELCPWYRSNGARLDTWQDIFWWYFFLAILREVLVRRPVKAENKIHKKVELGSRNQWDDASQAMGKHEMRVLCEIGNQDVQLIYAYNTRWSFQRFFFVHPYLRKIPILTHIFQMGWNHEAEYPSFHPNCSSQRNSFPLWQLKVTNWQVVNCRQVDHFFKDRNVIGYSWWTSIMSLSTAGTYVMRYFWYHAASCFSHAEIGVFCPAPSCSMPTVKFMGHWFKFIASLVQDWTLKRLDFFLAHQLWPVPWTSFPWCCWRSAPGCWAVWRAKVGLLWTLPLPVGARWPCEASRMTSMPGRRLWARKIRHCCWSRPRTHLGKINCEKNPKVYWKNLGRVPVPFVSWFWFAKHLRSIAHCHCPQGFP